MASSAVRTDSSGLRCGLQPGELHLRGGGARVYAQNLLERRLSGRHVATRHVHASQRELCIGRRRSNCGRRLNGRKRLITSSLLQEELTFEQLRRSIFAIRLEDRINEGMCLCQVAGRGIGSGKVGA